MLKKTHHNGSTKDRHRNDNKYVEQSKFSPNPKGHFIFILVSNSIHRWNKADYFLHYYCEKIFISFHLQSFRILVKVHKLYLEFSPIILHCYQHLKQKKKIQWSPSHSTDSEFSSNTAACWASTTTNIVKDKKNEITLSIWFNNRTQQIKREKTSLRFIELHSTTCNLYKSI